MRSLKDSSSKREPLYTVGGNVKWYNSCVKQFGSSSKVKHRITIWLSMSTPRYISKRIENRYSNTYTWTFIAALFTIAKNCKQPICPSTGKCTYIQWNITQIQKGMNYWYNISNQNSKIFYKNWQGGSIIYTEMQIT